MDHFYPVSVKPEFPPSGLSLECPNYNTSALLGSTNFGIKLIELRMKNIIYFYNNVEGEEELHEEEAAKLIVGETVERDGEYWTITKIDLQLAVSALPSTCCESISYRCTPEGSCWLTAASLDYINSQVSSKGQIAKRPTTKSVSQIKP